MVAFDENGNEIRQVSSNVSQPTKRQRWATQRLSKTGGLRKRVSIIDRIQHRSHSFREKRRSGASNDPMVEDDDGGRKDDGQGHNNNNNNNNEEEEEEGQQSSRTIYFNLPLPDSEKDEEGHIAAQYPRNKIRTSKYTPLTFAPLNIFYQFHQIANIYFLFIDILAVSSLCLLTLLPLN